MAKNEYEIIDHCKHNFRLFLVNLLYRTPHIHKDFEIDLVIDGSLSVITTAETFSFSTGDIFILNPFQSHEITAGQPSLILSLQISPAFFSAYYPQIEQIEFGRLLISEDSKAAGFMQNALLTLADDYFEEQEFGTIKCTITINRLFLLETQPYHVIPEKERKAFAKGKRMRDIMHYIDEHYMEKLLLSDIAEKEGLNLFYLSHFFKESFGVSFQDYVRKIRCEHARQAPAPLG